MTNTQNSSFAATVLDALNKIGSYHTGYLTATLTQGVVPQGYNVANIGDVFNLDLVFRPGSISGITLGAQLDKALVYAGLAHTVHIDWDRDLLVYTHQWENYSVHNWADDPSMAEIPVVVKFTGVTRKHFTTVLTMLLDAIAPIIIKEAPKPEPSKPAVVPTTVHHKEYGELPVIKLSDITHGY